MSSPNWHPIPSAYSFIRPLQAFIPSFSLLFPIPSIAIYTVAPLDTQIRVTVQAEFRDFGHIHAGGFRLVNRN